MKDWPSLVVRFPADADEALHDGVLTCLDPDDLAAVEERSDAEWIVSFRHPAARDAAAHDIASAFAARDVRTSSIDLSDEDWAKRSQAGLGAVRAGRFCIAPPWVSPDAADDPEAVHLVIEPSMGFGSGHHVTTRLCLLALQDLPVAGRRVLDIGTGSGILAIAAAKLGAASVLAIDNDPDALDAARTDAARNDLETTVVFRRADFRDGAIGQADTVLANITGAVLAAHAADIMACVSTGGHAVLSGITTAEAETVLQAFASGSQLIARRDEDGWVGLVLRRTDAPPPAA
jgi:ribosomal protein L11 methyltransferase